MPLQGRPRPGDRRPCLASAAATFKATVVVPAPPFTPLNPRTTERASPVSSRALDWRRSTARRKRRIRAGPLTSPLTRLSSAPSRKAAKANSSSSEAVHTIRAALPRWGSRRDRVWRPRLSGRLRSSRIASTGVASRRMSAFSSVSTQSSAIAPAGPSATASIRFTASAVPGWSSIRRTFNRSGTGAPFWKNNTRERRPPATIRTARPPPAQPAWRGAREPGWPPALPRRE